MLCTYPLSGDRLVHQAIYVCNTCHGQNTGQCCCSGCAFSCHDGHDVQFMAFGRGYCDCGAAGCALAHGSVEAARAMLPDGVSIALDEKGRIEGTMQTGLAIAPVQEAFITAPWDMIAQQCAQVVSRSKDTFWLSASDMTAPKCALEALAACIFQVDPSYTLPFAYIYKIFIIQSTHTHSTTHEAALTTLIDQEQVHI